MSPQCPQCGSRGFEKKFDTLICKRCGYRMLTGDVPGIKKHKED